ncbi:MAG: glycoside hydrolase family 99-like domain-containing protein [Burkholderiaceae bacterium]
MLNRPRLKTAALSAPLLGMAIALFALIASSLPQVSLIGASRADDGQRLRLGVYYFPGWKDGERGAPSPRPWDAIRPYPDREPLLGWYDESGFDVMRRQLGWMAQYGIDFVMFDWYWDRENFPQMAHALRAYQALGDRQGVGFAIMWANHSVVPERVDQFDEAVRHWIEHYFADPAYLRVDGRPVVMIFSAQQLDQNARGFGASGAALLERAQQAARRAGYPGIYFVGGTTVTPVRRDDAALDGYDALSAYNYHGLPRGRPFAGGQTTSHDFEQLARGYREHWQEMLGTSGRDYWLPITAGWDKRPWGGSRDPRHDDSRPDVPAFARHLREARATMAEHARQTRGIGLVCCWNEFGEGSYVEPTRGSGFGFLEAIRDVFGPR